MRSPARGGERSDLGPHAAPGNFGLPSCDPQSLRLRAGSLIRNVWMGASGRRDSYGNNAAGFVC